MRDSVTRPTYLFKKALDNLLYAISSLCSARQQRIMQAALSAVPFPTLKPSGWIPLYTMVTFRPDISYATVKRKAVRQSGILALSGWLGTVVVGATGLYWALKAMPPGFYRKAMWL